MIACGQVGTSDMGLLVCTGNCDESWDQNLSREGGPHMLDPQSADYYIVVSFVFVLVHPRDDTVLGATCLINHTF